MDFLLSRHLLQNAGLFFSDLKGINRHAVFEGGVIPAKAGIQNADVIANRFSTGVAICFYIFKGGSCTGACLRSISSTVALSLLRSSRKLALRAQTVRLSDAPPRQAPQRLGHDSRNHTPVQLRIILMKNRTIPSYYRRGKTVMVLPLLHRSNHVLKDYLDGKVYVQVASP